MKHLLTILFLISVFPLFAQYEYEVSEQYPYGRPNPKAPKQIKDYEPMMGKYKCLSYNMNPDRTWADPVKVTWTFKYIMNGMAVQDETLMEDGRYSGSIRQYIPDSSRWYDHFYSSGTPVTSLPVWEGNREDDKIVVYRDQKAPNGTDGYYRLTFYDFMESSYKWIGEWVDKTESVVFPIWKINCNGKL